MVAKMEEKHNVRFCQECVELKKKKEKKVTGGKAPGYLADFQRVFWTDQTGMKRRSGGAWVAQSLSVCFWLRS